jgi:hypothetical protein
MTMDIDRYLAFCELAALCERCGAQEDCGFVHERYLVGDPAAVTGMLCPACALAEHPDHLASSWLPLWGDTPQGH